MAIHKKYSESEINRLLKCNSRNDIREVIIEWGDSELNTTTNGKVLDKYYQKWRSLKAKSKDALVKAASESSIFSEKSIPLVGDVEILKVNKIKTISHSKLSEKRIVIESIEILVDSDMEILIELPNNVIVTI